MKCDGCGKAVVGVRYRPSGEWAGQFHCEACWRGGRIAQDVKFGTEEEWQRFALRHPRLVVSLGELYRIMDAVVSRQIESDDLAERVVFMLGRQAVEDFSEVLLAAGNGRGVAALKLLRPMFERVITMLHLIKHPKEAQDFWDHYWVEIRKAVMHVRDGGSDPRRRWSDQELTEIEAEYQRVRHRYAGTSWTPLDLATMARVSCLS